MSCRAGTTKHRPSIASGAEACAAWSSRTVHDHVEVQDARTRHELVGQDLEGSGELTRTLRRIEPSRSSNEA
jgi:hypothetical protein